MSLLTILNNFGSIGLTSLDAVRVLLQKNPEDTSQDEMLTDMIVEASIMLQNALGRQFASQDGVTKTFPYPGGGWINLGPYDLRTVSDVRYDYDGPAPTILTTTGYRVRGRTGDDTFRDLYLPDYVNDRPADSRIVAVTGNWGFGSVPADVERGVKITVKTWLREGAAFTSEGDLIRFERVGRIPQDVLDGLAHYRLPIVY